MKPPSTAKMLALRSLNKSLTQELPEWACHQLEQGKDAHYLRIAAGLTGHETATESEEIFDRVLEELNLKLLDPPAAWRSYLLERYDDYLAGQITQRKFLCEGHHVCLALDYPESIMPIYLLYFADEELRDQGWTYYWPDAKKEDFERLLTEEMRKIREASDK